MDTLFNILIWYLGICTFLASIHVVVTHAMWIVEKRSREDPRRPYDKADLKRMGSLMLREGAASVFAAATFPIGWLPAPKPKGHGPRPVLLVHGYFMNWASFLILKRRLARQGIGPIATVNLWPQFASMDRLARQLSDAIDRTLMATGAREVDVVAHSMGGLLARHVMAWDDGLTANAPRRYPERRVRRLVTIATAHKGTQVAYLALGDNGFCMRPGSKFIEGLAAPEQGRVTAIASEADNVIIPAESGLIGELGEDRWHTELGHFGLLMSPKVAAQVVDAIRVPGDDEISALPRARDASVVPLGAPPLDPARRVQRTPAEVIAIHDDRPGDRVIDPETLDEEVPATLIDTAPAADNMTTVDAVAVPSPTPKAPMGEANTGDVDARPSSETGGAAPDAGSEGASELAVAPADSAPAAASEPPPADADAETMDGLTAVSDDVSEAESVATLVGEVSERAASTDSDASDRAGAAAKPERSADEWSSEPAASSSAGVSAAAASDSESSSEQDSAAASVGEVSADGPSSASGAPPAQASLDAESDRTSPTEVPLAADDDAAATAGDVSADATPSEPESPSSADDDSAATAGDVSADATSSEPESPWSADDDSAAAADEVRADASSSEPESHSSADDDSDEVSADASSSEPESPLSADDDATASADEASAEASSSERESPLWGEDSAAAIEGDADEGVESEQGPESDGGSDDDDAPPKKKRDKKRRRKKA